MIDLHILNHAASTRPDWWQECLASAHAAEAAGLITLHVIDTTSEHIGANRAEAYALGNHEFVACLDNDDLLIPSGIPPLLQALSDQPERCGVYSDRTQIDANGNVIFTQRRGIWTPEWQLQRKDYDYPHHLAVYRRAAVMPHLEIMASFPVYSDFVLAGLVTQFGAWHHVPTLAYQRREKDYYVNHVRPIDPKTARRARDLVEPVLIHRSPSRR